MKLDQITEKETTTAQVVSKKRETATTTGYSGSILELLNPLKSVNINSDLHSFNNFRESKESIEALLKAQSNLVFYVLHQNFMCDDAHKEFFKNMVGRFYDLPQKFWDYYRGIDYSKNSNKEGITILGIVLFENKYFYDKLLKFDFTILKKSFKLVKQDNPCFDIKYLNALCLEEYWGGEYVKSHVRYFTPSNKKNIVDYDLNSERKWESISFDNNFEFGRFKTNKCQVKRKKEILEENFWFQISIEEIEKMDSFPVKIKDFISYYGVYASIGLYRMSEIVNVIKKRANELNIEFKDEWIPDWSFEDEKLIRSLSQTFQWSKDYIFENEDLLNLDVLGLNMTVPWDMDLVKFFVKRGYGGRMSENKAVFDKVFKPLLTDEILDMLFRLEYEKY